MAKIHKINPDWRRLALEDFLKGKDSENEYKYTKWDASGLKMEGIDSSSLCFEMLSVKDDNGNFKSTVKLAYIFNFF